MAHAVINTELAESRAKILRYHSPYHFLKGLPDSYQYEQFGAGRAVRFGEKQQERIFESDNIQILYELLPWDTAFFGVPTYRLFTVLFTAADSLDRLTEALQRFQKQLALEGAVYCFVEVPAEDIRLLQGLTQAGWRWNETRLHYYRGRLAEFEEPRYAVRLAQPVEAICIGQSAAAARNDYDRFHADPWFGQERADAFLARYGAAATEGYCDAVLIPDEPLLLLDSFLAISDLGSDAAALGVGLSRVVLTAVGPTNRGWHRRLVSETIHRARERGAGFVLMTTQATNGAVIRNAEKLNFALGSTTHILSYSAAMPSSLQAS